MVVNLVFHLVTYKIQSHLGNTCLDFLWAENFLCTMYLSTRGKRRPDHLTNWVHILISSEGRFCNFYSDRWLYSVLLRDEPPGIWKHPSFIDIFFEGFGKVSIKKYFVYGSFHNSSPPSHPPSPLPLFHSRHISQKSKTLGLIW